ncbi:hypothetical protein QTP86_003877 [Hemibagrus guttatus]|nr:hypothetical protein QTP86_003877 [Hemibagrus guttatus]
MKKLQEFKYLGSTVESNGECGKDVKKQVQAGWNGWRKVSGVLCDRKISARIKGKVYRTVVRLAMLYGLETVSLRKRQESELEVAELKMLRFSLGVTRLDRIRNKYIRGTAYVGHLGDKVREARLRWFGHVQRRETLNFFDYFNFTVVLNGSYEIDIQSFKNFQLYGNSAMHKIMEIQVKRFRERPLSLSETGAGVYLRPVSELLEVVGEQVGFDNILSASRMNKEIVVFLKSESLVNQLSVDGIWTLPPALPEGPRGIPRPAERHSLSSVSWVFPGASSRWGMPGTPPQGDIQNRCPSHLNCPLSMWRSSGSTPSSFRVTEFLTLSLRERPAALWRKLISATCIWDLTLSVMTQSL